ncbi:MAG: ABC transporter permease [Chloroflexota bacterium]
MSQTTQPASMTQAQLKTPTWFTVNNRRGKTILTMVVSLGFILLVMIAGLMIDAESLRTNLTDRNLAPSWDYPFGTDWLGRDMLTRTLIGLSLSLRIGLIAATISALIAGLLGLAAAMFGGIVDDIITWLIDVFLSLPHLVLLILISFALGGGTRGVVIAVAITHWPSLARVIRAEALKIRQSDYVQLSRQFGHSGWWIARKHIAPHIVPQFIVGLILLFPHAILHEAALSFVGIGLAPHTPAIGIILSEAMRHLSTGYWWLAVLPGLALLVSVKLFDILGENLRDLLNPKTSQG